MAAILVVDDSKIIRDLLSEYLSEQGYLVDVAIDGADGVSKALSGDYAVIFCDLHMPKKNGYQVYSEVSKARPEIPFIMTDSLPDELARQAEQAGACSCLTKPFDLDELTATLRKVLQTVKTS